MIKFFSKQMNKKGFTLIELIVVIAILAILALIAIPRIGSFRSKAAVSTHNANVRTLESAATMYLSENGLPKDDVQWGGESDETDTDWEDYMAAWPTIPKGLKDSDGDAVTDPYKVEITAEDGEVTVTPELIQVDDD